MTVSKLFQLKEWLTIKEAAQHLSGVFSEPVSEADVLRFALNRHLTLSVNIVNGAYGRRGRITLVEDAKRVAIEKAKADGFAKFSESIADAAVGGCMIDDKRVLDLEPDVVGLGGVYDLPLIGAEQLDIEHKYQLLTGGPAITLEDYEGAFVQQDEFTLYQLQESFDDNEFHSGSSAELERLKARIKSEKMPRKEADRLLKKHEKDRKDYLDRARSRLKSTDFYPAGGLPRDTALVVRTGALMELQKRVGDATKVERNLGSRAETTYLNIIGALVHLILGRSPGGRDHSIFNSEAAVIQNLLGTHLGKAGIAKRTLEDKFADAKRSLSAD